jgi:hypothetical protein
MAGIRNNWLGIEEPDVISSQKLFLEEDRCGWIQGKF